MFETGRRSAISTSELGLYSDRSDRYHKNRYSLGVRKYVIGVMVVLAVVLAAILLYDFTSGASAASKGSKETKHIYILQNALRRSNNALKKGTVTTASPDIGLNKTEIILMQDRSDDDNEELANHEDMEDQITAESRSERMAKSEPEFRAQNLNNFMMRKRILDTGDNESEEKVEGKQFHDNHAMIYRLRHRYKPAVSPEESSSEESQPAPFRFEYKTPLPASFKRQKYPQLSQYRYPYTSNNIQDIIKYLTHDPENPNRGIKFTGVYVNPKKYDLYPEVGEMMSNSDRFEEEEGVPYSYGVNSDPFYPYKPKHPSDVNLLAASNVRFSPSGIHRYTPPFEPYFPRPAINFNRPSSSSFETQYENPSTYPTSSFGKKRKPQPFSVMLDIYPISDVAADSNKKSSKPRPQPVPEEYDPRRPDPYNRVPKFYLPSPQPIPVVAIPSQQGLTEDEERQQMLFHLNLYPKKRNKMNRNDIIQSSHYMRPEDQDNFFDTIVSPFQSIAKHLTDYSNIQESKLEETNISDTVTLPLTKDGPSITRHEETDLDEEDKEGMTFRNASNLTNKNYNLDKSEYVITVPSNHKPNNEEGNATTEEYNDTQDKEVETTTEADCNDCNDPKSDPKIEESKKSVKTKDIDTMEGFQEFADGLLATD